MLLAVVSSRNDPRLDGKRNWTEKHPASQKNLVRIRGGKAEVETEQAC